MRRHRIVLLLLCFALALVVACGGGSAPTVPAESSPTATAEPEDPAASVSEADLERMVLGQEDLGALAAGFRVEAGASGIAKNAEVVNDFTALPITVAEITSSGRVTGYELTFSKPEPRFGPFWVTSSVELFTTPEAAPDFLDLYLEDSRASVGVGDEGVLIEATPEFALLGAGDRSGGVRMEARSRRSGIPFTYTIGYFQYGRLLGVVGIGGLDEADVNVQVTELTVTLAERVQAVLEGQAVGAAFAGPFDSARDASADIDAALALAAADGRRVLIDFGANWCPDCLVLDELLGDPHVRGTVDEGFHLVRVDVGFFDRNVEVAERYMPLLRDISTLVVLDPDGSVVTVAAEFADTRDLSADDVLAFLSAWTPPSVALR